MSQENVKLLRRELQLRRGILREEDVSCHRDRVGSSVTVSLELEEQTAVAKT